MKKISVSEFVRKNMAWVILAVILALFSFTPNFLSFQNIINILAQNAYVAVSYTHLDVYKRQALLRQGANI